MKQLQFAISCKN